MSRGRKSNKSSNLNIQKTSVADRWNNINTNKKINVNRIKSKEETTEIGNASGIKCTSSGKQHLTYKFAKEIMEMEVFEADRALDTNHVQRLIDAVRRGTYRPEQVQLMLCELNGKWYRMNGQHTCSARILWQDENPNYSPAVGVIKYKAKTHDDMRQLYASIDRNKSRSSGNIIASHLYGSDYYPDFAKQVINRLKEGLLAYLHGFASASAEKRDPDRLAHLLKEDYYDLAFKVGTYMHENKLPRHMTRSPVYAAMFATFNVAQGKSIEFWKSVDDGDMLASDDPRKLLRDKLQTHGVNAGRQGTNSNGSVTGDEMYAWCIRAWNSWRAGESITRLYGMGTAKNPPKAK